MGAKQDPPDKKLTLNTKIQTGENKQTNKQPNCIVDMTCKLAQKESWNGVLVHSGVLFKKYLDAS